MILSEDQQFYFNILSGLLLVCVACIVIGGAMSAVVMLRDKATERENGKRERD